MYDPLPIKKHTFFLKLTLPGYNWGTLFSKLEKSFCEDFIKERSEEELEYLISNDYDRYIQIRDDFFKQNKENLINEWFHLNEKSIEPYLETVFADLEHRILNKRKFSV